MLSRRFNKVRHLCARQQHKSTFTPTFCALAAPKTGQIKGPYMPCGPLRQRGNTTVVSDSLASVANATSACALDQSQLQSQCRMSHRYRVSQCRNQGRGTTKEGEQPKRGNSQRRGAAKQRAHLAPPGQDIVMQAQRVGTAKEDGERSHHHHRACIATRQS